MKSRHFLITDIDEKMIVEETTRKDILGYIDEHLENRINILSIVVDNPCTSITYGNYRINQYGVVNPSSEMKIDNNIIEVTNYE